MSKTRVVLMLSAGLLLGALQFQSPQELEAATCGLGTGPVCSQTVSCVWVGFAYICTTKFKYIDYSGGGNECEEVWAQCPSCHCMPNQE